MPYQSLGSYNRLVSVSPKALVEVDIPWDRTDGTKPADMQSTPAASRPSSGSSALVSTLACCRKQVGTRWGRTKTTPDFAISLVDLQDRAQILYGLWEEVFGAQNARDTLHGRDRPLIALQGLLIALDSTVQVLHLL